MTQQDGGRRMEMQEFDRDAEVWVIEGTFPSVYGGSGVMDVGCARLLVANRPITYHPSLSLFVSA